MPFKTKEDREKAYYGLQRAYKDGRLAVGYYGHEVDPDCYGDTGGVGGHRIHPDDRRDTGNEYGEVTWMGNVMGHLNWIFGLNEENPFTAGGKLGLTQDEIIKLLEGNDSVRGRYCDNCVMEFPQEMFDALLHIQTEEEIWVKAQMAEWTEEAEKLSMLTLPAEAEAARLMELNEKIADAREKEVNQMFHTTLDEWLKGEHQEVLVDRSREVAPAGEFQSAWTKKKEQKS